MIRNFFKALLAVAVMIGALNAPAYAIYNDQTRKYPARVTPEQQTVQYYSITVNYNDANIGTGQVFGALPVNAYILGIDAYVSTAFNAATTNVITLGATSANANEISASGTLAPGTTGVQHLTAAAGLGLAVTSNSTYQLGGTVTPYVPLYVKYTQTGTAATAGKVTIVISYTAPDM